MNLCDANKWRSVPGYDKYFVSKDGIVVSLAKSERKPKVLKQITSHDGYKYVFLYKGKQMKKHFVHRLILTSWVRLPKQGEEARHLDDVSDHNVLENLCWGTRLDNTKDRKANGGIPIGERSGTHKLTEKQVLEIKELYGRYSTRELGRMYGVSHTAIRRAALGIKWAHLKE